MKSTGIILAGGKSSRMGEDKGLMLYEGQPMVEYVLDALKYTVDDILIIANNQSYGQFGYPVYPDLIPDKGPVGGICTGLHYSETELNICLSCDVPMVTSEFLFWLIGEGSSHAVTLPRCNGKIHQLMGIYHRSALPVFKKNLEEDKLKLRLVNEQAGCLIVDVEKSGLNFGERIFSNMNTKADLNKGYGESKR